MIIYKSDDVNVSRIDFCCSEMASDILLGKVKTNHWTDHDLAFYVGDYRIDHCPQCGAEIKTQYDGDS